MQNCSKNFFEFSENCDYCSTHSNGYTHFEQYWLEIEHRNVL